MTDTTASMTALVSAFARAFHFENNAQCIFEDGLAKQLLSPQEYAGIGQHMAKGIGFFNPALANSPAEEALRWVVDTHLSPAPLARGAFGENSLAVAVGIGAKQYVLLGAGYDTFAYRQPQWAEGLHIFEVDHPATAADKQRRLQSSALNIPNNVHFVSADFNAEGWTQALTGHPAFDATALTFCSAMGLSYYLSEWAWASLLQTLSTALPAGSSLVFDYPDENSHTEHAGERAKRQAMLAKAANETMHPGYSYSQMEKLLANWGFLIYEHLTPADITQQYFKHYNQANPAHPMEAFDNVNLCLAVKNVGIKAPAKP